MQHTLQAAFNLVDAVSDERADTIKEIGKIVIVALRKAGFEVRPTRKVRNPVRIAATRRGTPRSESAQARVLHIIQKYPGSRGFQIVARSAEAGQLINERTVRTALARLKKRHEIEMRQDGAWYPKEILK